VEKIVMKASKLVCGDPADPQTDVGTVIDESSAILFEKRVKDAVALGAEKLYGNERQGALFYPTVLDHVPWDCELVMEETFGPAIPIIRIKDIDDAIKIANGTSFGLSSGVCTNRLDDVTRFINELNHGTVNIWEVPGYRIEMSPFGGIKDSGLGYKEGVMEAMKSYTNLKTFSMPWM
jgi:acyl-CoA reductase-like NAD-dependent aldehyde dehydrogenase